MPLPLTPIAEPKLRSSPRTRVLLWLLLGAVLVLAIAGFLALLTFSLTDTNGLNRDLADFASPAESRAFASAHLPVPLPKEAVVESLHFERWTDWNLTATVRLPSAEALALYLEQTKRDRKLYDEFCYHDEPAQGARYYLKKSMACGTIERVSPAVIEIRCNTR